MDSTRFSMRLLAVVLAACLAQGYTDDDGSGSGEPEPKCTMGEWGDWGPCVRSPACPRHLAPQQLSHSFSLRPSAGFDSGRQHMMRMNEQKRRQWRNRETCAEDHSCPELDSRSSNGATPCVNGTAGIYPCRNVDMLAYIGMKDLTGGIKLKHTGDVRGSDIWGWIDPMTGDEYAIMGVTHGTSFVRITDPENPVVVAFLQTRTYPSIWRDIKVVSDVAYIGSEAWNHGIQVFDLKRLRDMKKFKEVSSDFDYEEIGNSHNIISNEESKFIYIVGDRQRSFDNGCKGGLHMVDVSEPLKPKFTGCFADDGYTHDAQCIVYRDGPDRRYRNHEICFAYNEDSLTIIDVTNKEHPDIIAKIGYEGTQYTHQGWVTEDLKFLLMDDELDEMYSRSEEGKHTRTLVWDISYLRAPKLVTSFWSHVQAIDHNQYIRKEFAYQSNYEAGLRILHVKPNSHSLMEVAYFDVFPSRTSARFGGTWSNYPYYNSDVVAVSSIEYGLFLLKPNRDAITDAITRTAPYGERIRMRPIEAAEDPSYCPAQGETMLCTPKDCP